MTFTLKKGISANGIDQLKYLEGERLKVYRDEAGYATVGVGHKVMPVDNLKVGDTITPLKSGQLLKNDLINAERAVSMGVKVPLNKNQYDALVSFVFNVGSGALLTGGKDGQPSTLLLKLNDYDYQGALKEFTRWKYVTKNGVKIVSDILVRRRKFEQNLFNS